MKETSLIVLGFFIGLFTSVNLMGFIKENNPIEGKFYVTKIKAVDDKNSLFYINYTQKDQVILSTIIIKAPHDRYHMDQYLVLQ